MEEGYLSYVNMLNNVVFIQGRPGLRINRKCIKKQSGIQFKLS